MMSLLRLKILPLVLAIGSGTTFASPAPVTNITDLAAALASESGIWRGFDITAQVTFPDRGLSKTFAVGDGSNTVPLVDNLFWPSNQPFTFGDRIHASGHIESNPDGTDKAICDHIKVLGKGPEIAIPEVDFHCLLEKAYRYRTVRLRGRVREAFRDEIDPVWTFLVLKHEGRTAYVVLMPGPSESNRLSELVDAEISVIGLNQPPKRSGNRKLAGPLVMIPSLDAVTILMPASEDPFDVPSLDDAIDAFPETIAEMGRRRVKGHVIAVCSDTRLLIQDCDKRIFGIDLSDAPSPAFGTAIEVSGFPETDLYRINLSRATWRPVLLPVPQFQEPEDVTARYLLTDNLRNRKVKTNYHGKPIRLQGTVRSLPTADNDGGLLYLESDGFIITVNARSRSDALADISVGCELSVCGICVMETDNWHSSASFPRIRGLSIVVRTPEDIRILARPPWWTANRLLGVIGTLFAVLVGILVWNTMLRRLAERRGKDLADEQVARATADLRVYERTRLAVELHDTLAQSLTGISMEIRTADRLSGTDRETMHQHLHLAAKTVDSCRTGLRNCIWDLRNDVLDEPDLEVAIRRILAPQLGDTRLLVRFNVPRERLSDNTTHSLLQIVRELVTNAIRHGHARNIRVAGSIEDGQLLFSVRDDGCGFDPENHPGIDQGHFGLQGIHERVDGFAGEMSITSAPGEGTKVTIAIRLQQTENTTP